MRLSTRSILSPGRAASGGSAVVGGGDRSTSALATTLSRRLRRNGSLRGGAQSPALFPATATTTKKSRGSSAFAENPEPSSPKVTCIGQVRVKTKKQGKKMKLRACGSKRIGGEASFRRIQQPPPPPPPPTDSPARNPRWVHLPSSICETLKGFGSEFSCLLPCKSSCFSSNNNNNNNDNVNNNINNDNNRCLNSGNNGGSTTCGGVFRWWVSVEEGGGEGRRRDIELVVGGNDEEDDGVDRDRVRVMERECSRRRSIFDDVEFDDLFNGVANNVGSSEDKVEEDVVGRISVCVPPKNALLLMRCKSDPMRMASLSKKFLEASSFVECHSDGEDGFVEGKVRNHVDFGEVVGVKEEESEEIRDDLVEKMEEIEEVRAVEEVAEHRGEVIGDVEEKPCVENREETEGQGVLVEENRNETEGGQSFENVDEDEQVTEMMEGENGVVDVVDEEVVDESEIWQVFIEMPRYEAMEVEEEATGEEGPEELSSDLLTCCLPLEESKEVDINEESVVEVVKEVVVVEDEEGRKSMEKEVSKSILPDCLLLMMCEPKLSMEVSKETWVRRSDFVRCLPERHLKQKPKQIDDVKDQPIVSTKKPKPAAVAAQPPLPPTAQTGIRPGRSSISFPTGGSTVAKKLAKVGVGVGVGVGYEPFVLPRCKSAPMRSAAKFGQPELACSMWGRENGRKLEPHRPATCGVGAAGVGF